MVDESPFHEKESIMAEAGVSVSDVGTLAGLYGGISGRHGGGAYGGGGGYGSGYGGYLGSMYGDHSAIRADVQANRDIDLMQSVNKNTTDGFLSAQIASNKDFLNAKIDAEALARNFADVQNQINQNTGAVQAELSRQSRASAECCCKTRVEAAEAGAKLDAILANQVQARNDLQHNDLARRIDEIDKHGRH